jgi:pantoate--beta-alanine ligase
MIVLRNGQDLVARARELGAASCLGGVFVPTMGALHEGHAQLIRRGAELAAERKDAGGCVVSIFVNPTQFNDPADFDRYPRTEAQDLALCEASGATQVFVPGVETIYPPPPAPPTPVPALPAVALEPGLEDAFRPGHFAGVCQVVMRLFRLVGPRAALFGEKDWQQLQVLAAMTRKAGLPIEIIPMATVRDADGLALSSRNRFLSAEDRQRALAIARALRLAGQTRDSAEAERAMARTLADAGITPDYAAVRDGETLRPISEATTGRALIAARVGAVRLIDNAPWPW